MRRVCRVRRVRRACRMCCMCRMCVLCTAHAPRSACCAQQVGDPSSTAVPARPQTCGSGENAPRHVPTEGGRERHKVSWDLDEHRPRWRAATTRTSRRYSRASAATEDQCSLELKVCPNQPEIMFTLTNVHCDQKRHSNSSSGVLPISRATVRRGAPTRPSRARTQPARARRRALLCLSHKSPQEVGGDVHTWARSDCATDFVATAFLERPNGRENKTHP